MTDQVGGPPIRLSELNHFLLHALPELRSDLDAFERLRAEDPEFTQSFFGYSFIPTLQAALDRGVEDFCRRAFLVIEELVISGDHDVRHQLDEELFSYGPRCESWMRRAGPYMGPRALAKADQVQKAQTHH